MGLYIGNIKQKIKLSSTTLRLNLYSSSAPIVNGVILKSSDDKILKDLNGVYLTATEGK